MEDLDVEYCYRHPAIQTGVHCTRCENPICPDCMIPAPVGYQCPECVARAKQEFRAADPTRSVRVAAKKMSGSITRTIIGILAGAFVIELLFSGAGMSQALLSGPTVTVGLKLGATQSLLIASGEYWRLFTAIFLHGGILHLAMNCYALWIFGPIVEEELGKVRFALLFLVTGVAGNVLSYAVGAVNGWGVGASGAIFGIFGAFFALNYRRRRHSAMAAANVRSALTLILINALLAAGIHIIDWRAHLGGLIAGFAIGYVAEGIGPRKYHRAIEVGVFAAVIILSIVTVIWRTDAITQQFLSQLPGALT